MSHNGSLEGPAEYFAKHPVVYALSLAGAGTAVAVFSARAAGARGVRRLPWIALFVLEAAILIGMVVTREEARRSLSTYPAHQADA